MLLVTGATGNIGRELVRELAARGAAVRVLVRDPARAAALLPEGAARADPVAGAAPVEHVEHVERVVGDLDVPATLPRAFTGADKVFLLTPGMGDAHARHAVAAARVAGVRHIVHVSSVNVLGVNVLGAVPGDRLPAMGRWHLAREEIIRASGLPVTFLRPGDFMTNALAWTSTIRDGNYVLDPVGPGRVASIDPADIAAVAARVLADPGAGHHGKAYVLTGDEPLTVAERVQIIAKTIGRDIEVRAAATPAQAARSRYPGGAPQELIDAVTEVFVRMRADTVGFQTDTVRRLLGRRPRTFADWCARHAAAFSDG
jgi:uncharacterized protein YbjT (DUF2867 family)